MCRVDVQYSEFTGRAHETNVIYRKTQILVPYSRTLDFILAAKRLGATSPAHVNIFAVRSRRDRSGPFAGK